VLDHEFMMDFAFVAYAALPVIYHICPNVMSDESFERSRLPEFPHDGVLIGSRSVALEVTAIHEGSHGCVSCVC
jgi:hypothetical protein